MDILLFILLFITLAFAGLLLGFHFRTRRIARESLKQVPQLGEVVPVPGGSMHYIEKGNPEKQTLVMINGLSGQLQHFTYALVDDLAADFHVVALDRPGCGYSTRNHAALATLPEQARMVHAFLEARNISNAVFVGHSMGGAVSLAVALDYPSDVAGLALLCPLTHHLPEQPAAFRPLEIRTQWLRALIGQTIAVPLASRTAPLVLKQVFAPETAPDDFLIRAGGALGLRPEGFITASQDVVGTNDSIRAQVARYSELAVPGGVLFGAQDQILSPEEHGTPMKAFGLETISLENRGHMIPITAPKDCAAFIRRVAKQVN